MKKSMNPHDPTIIVAAAGRGARSGLDRPKQFQELHGKALIAHTLDALAAACPTASILCVINPQDRPFYEAAVAQISPQTAARLLPCAAGGATRQASVRAGLERLALLEPPPARVLIHDAARPFVSAGLIASALQALERGSACAPGAPLVDTVKRVDATGLVLETPDRANLRAVQTPQAFAFDLILDAHRRAFAAGVEDLTDDAAAAEWAGHRVHVFPGEAHNDKITLAEDFSMAEARLSEALCDIRTGQGFDVHAFGEGDRLYLGGVEIAHDHGLSGHSDADVLMHAITDALLGAIADGDIGSHFPPSDPQWKGAASEIFLRHALNLVRARGGLVAHVDATLICETPKIGPHRDRIRANLARLMGLALDRVAVKATTSERLGFTGRQEGVAAMALATVRLPASARGPAGSRP